MRSPAPDLIRQTMLRQSRRTTESNAAQGSSGSLAGSRATSQAARSVSAGSRTRMPHEPDYAAATCPAAFNAAATAASTTADSPFATAASAADKAVTCADSDFTCAARAASC